jgi:hypothetical protein
VGDINGDGRNDVVSADYPGGLEVHYNDTKTTPQMWNVSVIMGGGGTGRVVTDPPGIDCRENQGESCRAEFADGTHATFTAIPDPGSRFESWYGKMCDNNIDGTCTMVVCHHWAVQANFVKTGHARQNDGREQLH